MFGVRAGVCVQEHVEAAHGTEARVHARRRLSYMEGNAGDSTDHLAFTGI